MELFPSDTLLKMVQVKAEGTFCGRIVRIYFHGCICLMKLACNGLRIRAVAKKSVTENYKALKPHMKLGTLVCGIGEEQLSHGNKEILIRQLFIIRPNLLTEQETGLQEGSQFSATDRKKFYHSYLCYDDLASMNIQARATILWSLRQFLHDGGYIECTTPVMSRYFHGGGAHAFITHMRDSNRDMYLRITSEIALKLIMGGGTFQKVFEIGYSFRNGSVSAKYETPFYAAEIYTTLIQEHENIALGLEIIREIERKLDAVFHIFHAEKQISFLDNVPIITFADYYQKKSGNAFDWEALKADNAAGGSMCADTYKQLKKNFFTNQNSPIIITDLPAGTSPLLHKKDEAVLCRSYLVANHATLMEFTIGENDPQVLESELYQQAQQKKDHYQRDDSAYLHAYKMGMPYIASIFIGIDRIFPALLNLDNINDLTMKL